MSKNKVVKVFDRYVIIFRVLDEDLAEMDKKRKYENLANGDVYFVDPSEPPEKELQKYGVQLKDVKRIPYYETHVYSGHLGYDAETYARAAHKHPSMKKRGAKLFGQDVGRAKVLLAEPPPRKEFKPSVGK